MSIDKCTNCARPVDTDLDVDCYVADVCYCERCRDVVEFCEHECDCRTCGECHGAFGVGA